MFAVDELPLTHLANEAQAGRVQLHRPETELLTGMTMTQGHVHIMQNVGERETCFSHQGHMLALRFLWILLARANMCIW
jgi:hypothetical protein